MIISDITLHELVKDSLELCYEIEGLPASEQQTKVSLQACALKTYIEGLQVSGGERPPIALVTELCCVECGERMRRLDDQTGLSWIHSVGKFCAVHRLRHAAAPNTELTDRRGAGSVK